MAARVDELCRLRLAQQPTPEQPFERPLVRVTPESSKTLFQTRSSMSAMPCPTPMHMVHSA